jgi:hypothetical protein
MAYCIRFKIQSFILISLSTTLKCNISCLFQATGLDLEDAWWTCICKNLWMTWKVFSHSKAIGLGPAADWWARVCNLFLMTWRPQGTTGTGSVWVGFFYKFFFFSQATGLGPAADGWTCVCNSFSMTWRPLHTTGAASVWVEIFLEFFFSLSSHWTRPSSCLMDSCFLDIVNALDPPGHCRLGLSRGRFRTDGRTDGRTIGRWPRGRPWFRRTVASFLKLPGVKQGASARTRPCVRAGAKKIK